MVKIWRRYQCHSANTSDMISVLIVDDHQILRDGLHQMLSDVDNVQVVGTASNGREALDWLTGQHADVILMDVSMPVMDGAEATSRIRKQYPGVNVLALTMLDQGSFVQLMLRNGASGYLVKDTSKEELVEAIRTVHGGNRYLGKHATDILVNHIGHRGGSTAFLPALTRREKEVLTLIVRGLSDASIASELFVSKSTVESHRKNLRSKLGARNAAEIVRIAMERGLVS